MHPLLRAGAIAATIAAAHPSVPIAAEPAPGAPLTLEASVRRALESHPSVRAAARRVVAAGDRLDAASRFPGPALSLGLENFGGALGSGRLESTAALEQTIALGGDRAARRGVAAAERAEREAVLALERRALALETGGRFLDAWSAGERLRAARDAEATAAAAVAAASERLRQGAAPESERVRAEGQLAMRSVERRRAESELASTRSALAAQWGDAEPGPDSLALPDPPAPPARAGAEALAAHPEQRLAAVARDATEARAREARADATPDASLTAGLRHLEEAGGAGFLLGVSLPLPFATGRAALDRAAAAELEAAVWDARAAAMRLRLRYDAALERERAAYEAWSAVAERVTPAAERALELVVSGYRAGRLGYLEIHDAQRSALEARELRIEATAEAWRARLVLDALLGLSPDATGTDGGAR